MSLDVPEIDRLIECDAANIAECKRLLSEVSPSILEAINDAVVLYATVNRNYGQSVEEIGHFDEIHRLLDERGLESDAELIPVANSDPEVKGVLDRFRDRDLRGAILVRIGVLSSQLFADLFRIRMTAPYAYLRVQVESVALLEIMTGDPSISVEWSDVGTDDRKGREFFNKYKSKVFANLERRGLKTVYDMASGIAVHSRFSGLALAATFAHRSENGRWERSTEVRPQEFDPDDPLPFLMFCVYALRTQLLILKALVEVVPELNDPILRNERVPRLGTILDAVVEDVKRFDPRKGADPSNAA